ncbi:hypothetical protein [Enterovirga aerilata]|uniref:Uncharacterized protein n=1 Tax=Enterovirga aerilata TaxID=2730920 RepID=A0A849I3Y6_9HYPH|nr:hypothetical protein [Enterovirga sp. DB1703]NNM72364.1 hypothetical protein [Enterovirga sp. DB1703]
MTSIQAFRAGLFALAMTGAAQAQEVPRTPPNAELEACKTTGLLALKERSPAVTDVLIDPDAVTIAKADTKVEDTPVKGVIMGEAYLEKNRTEKPHRFVCLIGEKGKVLLTFFTQQ